MHPAQGADDHRTVQQILRDDILQGAGPQDLAALDDDRARADLGQLGQDVRADEDGLALRREHLEQFAQLDPRVGSESGTYPTMRCAVSGSSTTETPSTKASPLVGSSSVARMRMVVLLPAPLGPTKPKISRDPKAKETSSTARVAP